MTATLLELEDELTHLTLAPELGGSIVNWTVLSTGQPLLRLVQPHRRRWLRLPRWLAGPDAQQPDRSAAHPRQRLAKTVASGVAINQ